MSEQKVFFDTNIALYTQDPRDPTKQQIARETFATHTREGTGVISTQVLQEFYVILTSRFNQVPLIAKRMVQELQLLELVTIAPPLIERAIDTCVLNRISFWDALIVAAAEAAKCNRLLTEDLSHGQIINGVKIENPFLKA